MVNRVPVSGGSLAVEVTPGTTASVLAIHGVSSHRRLWDWLRLEAPELTLIAPDLRGRADSLDVTGPSSVGQHADDMVAVLDALKLDTVHVLGMSMGGFVAVDLAHRYPQRVTSLILVDGGFPMATPPGLTRETIPAMFADRVGRLGRAWTLDDFVTYFTTETGPLLDPNDPQLRTYLSHDLDEHGRVRLSEDALVSDAASVFFDENPWQELTVPIRFLHAQWAIGKDSAPGYPDVSAFAPKCVETRYVEGTDHAGIIMSPEGAATTAAVVKRALV